MNYGYEIIRNNSIKIFLLVTILKYMDKTSEKKRRSQE